MFRKLRRSKRGSVQDILFIGVAMLFFSMVLLIGFKITNSFNDQIQVDDTIATFDIDGKARASSTTLTGFYSGIIDDSFLFLTIGLAIIALIFAALVRIHPIFIPFFFIALLFVIFLCGIFSNIYQEMAASPSLASEAAALTFTSLIMTYLPFIVGIVGTILMVVMYKLRSIAGE